MRALTVLIEENCIIKVILLQISLVSPGTHLMKNHESQSRTNESYIKDA